MSAAWRDKEAAAKKVREAKEPPATETAAAVGRQPGLALSPSNNLANIQKGQAPAGAAAPADAEGGASTSSPPASPRTRSGARAVVNAPEAPSGRPLWTEVVIVEECTGYIDKKERERAKTELKGMGIKARACWPQATFGPCRGHHHVLSPPRSTRLVSREFIPLADKLLLRHHCRNSPCADYR